MLTKLKSKSSLKLELNVETPVELGIFIFPILLMILFPEITHFGIRKRNGP